MQSIQQFIERNINSYTKHTSVTKDIINKYKEIYQGNSYFPEELL